MPSCTKIGGRHVRQIGSPSTTAWCASARRDSFSWMSMWRSKCTMPIRSRDIARCRARRETRSSDRRRASPAARLRENTWGDAARDLVEALLQIGRNGEHVAGVAQRHLLAQVDAELVIVGVVEGGDAPDALRSANGCRADRWCRNRTECRSPPHRICRRRARSPHRAP